MFNETSYNLALDAGCPPQGAALAAAIAQAESSGNPRAYNPKPPDLSYGLWQINMIGGLGPARRSQFGISSNEQLFDPRINAAAMFQVSNGCTNFRPWTTYTSGAYRQHLPATSPAGGGSMDTGTDAGSDAGGGVDGETITTPVDFFSGAPAWMPIAALAVAAFLIMR